MSTTTSIFLRLEHFLSLSSSPFSLRSHLCILHITISVQVLPQKLQVVTVSNHILICWKFLALGCGKQDLKGPGVSIRRRGIKLLSLFVSNLAFDSKQCLRACWGSDSLSTCKLWNWCQYSHSLATQFSSKCFHPEIRNPLFDHYFWTERKAKYQPRLQIMLRLLLITSDPAWGSFLGFVIP